MVLDLTVGKEWQKGFTPKNMGYYGVDLGVGFSESRTEQHFETSGIRYNPKKQ